MDIYIKLSGALQSDDRRLYVDQIIRHPDYNDTTLPYPNDIALLRLTQQLVWGWEVRPIALPAMEDEPVAESQCTMIGWGMLQAYSCLFPYI